MKPPLRTVVAAGIVLGIGGTVGGALAQVSGMAEAAKATLVHPEFLEQYAATLRFRLGRPTAFAFSPDGDAVFYRRSPPRSFVHDLYAYFPATGREQVILTAESLLRGATEGLTAEEKARRERQRLVSHGIAHFVLSEDGSRAVVPLSGRLYLVDLRGLDPAAETQSPLPIREIAFPEGVPIDPTFSPSGDRLACALHGDLWVVDLASGRRQRLTEKENDAVSYGVAEFVAQEEMDRHRGYWWSPEGDRILCQRSDHTGVEEFHIGDPLDPGAEPHTEYYPRPGMKNVDVSLVVVPVRGGRRVRVEWDRERYPYLAAATWERGAPPTFLVQNRAQTEEVLFAADPRTGKATPLLTERDDAWLNIDSSMPYWLPGGEGFFWTTERNGTWELELHAPDGRLIRTVAGGALGFRKFLAYHETGRAVLVTACTDPTRSQVWRVPLDPATGSQALVSPESGVNTADFGKNSGIGVVTENPEDGPTRFAVVRAGGRYFGTIPSMAETPSVVPHPEWATVGDLELNAVVLRPETVRAGTRYPVLVAVYGGPHAQMVTRSRDRYLFHQWLADQGYVVVAIDGRGTPNRGREWERSLRGSFVDLPLADQVAGLEALGKRFPEMDMSRVGIEGWSYGGYMAAMAVLRRPEVFRAGVAGAPVTDWRYYDTHYTERYIGLPQDHPDWYEESSVLTYASKLSRPLLVIHGTDDDNVYFLHSLKLADALFRAGRSFDFLPLTRFTHLVSDPVANQGLYERIVGFLGATLGAGSGESKAAPPARE